MKSKSKKVILAFASIGLVFASIATTMYLNQTQRFINRDTAANATDVISTLSCILNYSGAHNEANSTNPNPPAYEVLIDVESCRPNAAVSENTIPTYTRYWVEPKFINGSLTVKAWTVGTQRQGFILAKIDSGADVQPPFGQWTVNWCTERLTGDPLISTDPCARKGHITISADQTYELFYREENSGTQTAFDKFTKGFISSDSTSGAGKYFERFNGLDSTIRTGKFAFANGALLDDLNGGQSCKDPRSSGNLKRTVWDAALYDTSTQALYNHNGGFPVKQVGGDSLGWAGFEGVRLNGNSNPEISGSFVRQDSVGGIYTAVASYGKLIKNTNTILPNGLGDLDKIVLRARLRKDAFQSLTTIIDPTGDAEQSVLLYWDNLDSKFVIIARDKYRSGIQSGKEFIDITPVRLSPAQYLSLAQSAGRTFERRVWAFQIGSNNNYVIQLADNDVGVTTRGSFYPSIKPVNDIQVFRQIQKNVVPGSLDAPTEDLVCIGKCPRPRPDNESGSPLFLEADYEFSRTDSRVEDLFTYDNSTGNLTLDGLPVRFGSAFINRRGIDTNREDLWLGTFVTRGQLADLECRDGFCVWDTVGYSRKSATNTFGDMGLQTYYNWNTGPQRWQRFSGVKDSSGRVVPIEEPMMLTYDAPNESEFGRYQGKKVSIRFPGNGQLWMPGRCENITDPALNTTNGCNGLNEVFIHDFVIPTDSGSRGRVKDATGREYLVKWSRQGVYFPQHSNVNSCQSAQVQSRMTAAEQLVLPTSSTWVNPRAEMLGLGNPSAGSSPRYINGERVR